MKNTIPAFPRPMIQNNLAHIIYLRMFPTTTKEGRSGVSVSPKHRQGNRSTYLPYFKRFPNQRFLSHDRKRSQEHQYQPPRRFFTQEKHEPEHEATQFGRFNSNAAIKEKTPLKLRPKLFRQKYERQSNRIKRTSQATLDQRPNRVLVNSSFQLHNFGHYLTANQVLRGTHNLLECEVEEIKEYDEIYYFGQNCAKKLYVPQQKSKDGDEGYPWSKGDHVSYRYELLQVLGEGSFGQVYRVLDHKHNKTPMALKMVKFNEKYLTQSRIEIKILKLIKDKDPNSTKNCIELKDYFSFRGRVCMTFNLLSMNLYELIKSNGYYGLPLDLIRRFVLQILNGIHFLHRNKIIHADLKPENILLKEMNKSGVKIIDFGSSCLEGETIYTYIQSRYYRGPEVILGLPYDRKIDIWSFGCIIAELHLGYPLFGGEDEHEQMCLIVEVLGMPPKDMIPNAKRWHVFFDSSNVLKPHEKRVAPGSKSLTSSLEMPDEDFTDFISQCLQWHPERRIEALQLMKHRWVLKDLPADFKEQHLKFVHEEQVQAQQQESQLLKKSRKHTFSIRDRHRLIK